MKKDELVEAVAIFVIACFAIGVVQIPFYLVLAMVIGVFSYIIYRNKNEIERKLKSNKRELEHEIKMTASDAYLKHKQLITVVSNLPAPLALLDEEGKVVLYNKYFENFRKSKEDKLLTYNQNDFVKDVYHFVNDAYIFEREIDKNINVHGFEYVAMSAPITTNQKYSGCVILFQDVSKAKEKEEMQKQFIADASHELRTPISAIKGMIEIINREEFDDIETEKDFLKQIEKENRRLEEIVKNLLQLSKLSTDNVILKRSLQEFTKVIDASIDSLTFEAQEKKIWIQKDYRSHELVFFDFEKMEIVMNNLLSNAIKYSIDGTITVRTYMEEDVYVLEIEDEGCGIQKQEIDKIFERFYRVDNARHRKTGGSGLGLAIVKSIVYAHNAKISVTSEIGKGTTFTIRLK